MTRTQPKLTLPALLALALAAAGCADTFTPASVVEDRRILALVVDPPALDASAPGATFTARAFEAAPPTAPAIPEIEVERRWSFCPFSLGASVGYACAVPACEVALPADAAGVATVDPRAEAEACLAALGASAPPELSGGLPPVVEVLVRRRLVWVRPGQAEVLLREAVQRVPVWLQPPTAPLNAAPAFAAAAVQVGATVDAQPCLTPDANGIAACPSAGDLLRGQTLRIVARIDPSSVERYQVGDRAAEETFLVSFYTSAGRFDEDRGAADPRLASVGVSLKHEEVAGPRNALLWVVLRDLRGGEATAGPFRFQVDPPIP